MDDYIILTLLGISLLKGIIRSMDLPLTHIRRGHQRSVAKHMENDLQNQLHCLDIKKIMKVSKVLLGHTSSYLIQSERYPRYRTSRNLKRVCRVSAPKAASLVGKWLESLGILSKLSFREVFDSWYFFDIIGKGQNPFILSFIPPNGKSLVLFRWTRRILSREWGPYVPTKVSITIPSWE